MQYGAGSVAAALEERIDPRARSSFVVRQSEGLPVIEARLPHPFRTIFTTRHGGGSRGRFASLNLDVRAGRDLAAGANRERVAQIVGRRLVSPAQEHGLRVTGAAEYAAGDPDAPCDGLTLHPILDQGLAAALLFADCLPIVLYGEVDMAAVHGGWRGILGGIVQQAGQAMIGPPAAAVVGPSIGPCCFIVAEEVAEAFVTRFGPGVIRGAGAANSADRVVRVDLWAAVEAALVELGVPPGRVANPRLCTACHSDLFYSYRREGPVTGRHACVSWTEAA